MSRTSQAAEYLQGLRDDDFAVQAQVFRDVIRGWNDADWELWADRQELGLAVRPAARPVWTGPLVQPEIDPNCPF